MSKVKAQRIEEGQIPTERMVDVRTADGTEEQVIVSDRHVKGDYLLVSEVYAERDKVLVELPREAMSGTWRVWIQRDELEAEK